MQNSGSLERMETVDALLLRLERDLCAGTLAEPSNELHSAVAALAGALDALRAEGAGADPRLRPAAHSLRERVIRLKVLLQRGESFFAMRLSHLAVSCGNYSPAGTPTALEFRGVVEAEG